MEQLNIDDGSEPVGPPPGQPSKVGFAQYEVVFGEYDRNVASLERLAAEGAEADLLVFPELALTGYEFIDSTEVERYAEPFNAGRTSELLQRLAAKHNTTLVLGYPEYTTKGCYNSAMLVCPDGSMTNYRKLHLFSRETQLFISGDAEPPVVETPAGRVGMMICFDWLFPETARMLALQGAQIIAHPSNLVLDYCQKAMYCRALENAVYIITANRIGTEDRAGRTLTFTGRSQVVDPAGKTLASAKKREEGLAVVEIHPEVADNKAITEFNDRLGDRRAALYGSLLDPLDALQE